MKKTKRLLLVLLAVSFLFRVWRINYPSQPIWDELYYSETVQGFLSGDNKVWDFTQGYVPGHLYIWENPPFPVEIMALFSKIFTSSSPYVLRLPSVFLGTLSVYLIYLLGQLLFKDQKIALLSALFFSVDGLNFVLSRTAMLDIYLVCFILASLAFFLKKQYLISAIFLGLALASKWTAVYLLPLFIPILLWRKDFKGLLQFLAFPFVYLATYLPFFLSGYNLTEFFKLLSHQFNYHLNLNIPSSYASPWWSWPLNLNPVWFFTQFTPNKIAIIMDAGTCLFWLGSLSIVHLIYRAFKTREFNLLICIFGFMLFWLPWSLSPRTMFIYYFAPAVPFLCLALAYTLSQVSKLKSGLFITRAVIFLCIFNFLIFYPFFSGIILPRDLVELIFRVHN